MLEQAPAEVDTEPRPSTRTVSVPGVPAAANVADTLFAAVMLTVQVAAVPVHDPPQPRKDAPEAGDWLRTAVVPGVKVAVHVVAPLPQLIPLPVTRPGPVAETVSANVLVPPENAAVTVFAALNVTVHVGAVPVHVPPPQPVNVAPLEGVAVRVTAEFAACPALVQAVAPEPQLIPPPVTVPFPVTETVRVKPVPVVAPLKVAVTFLDWVIDTVQVVALPPQAPVQPMKVAPSAGVATSPTVAPAAKLAEQMDAPPPQLIAPLPPVTAPFPLIATERTFACVNVAVTAAAAVIVTVHVGAVPVQLPVQPVKTYPSPGEAVSVTAELSATLATQVLGQSMLPPDTWPLPATLTVSCAVEPPAGAQAAPTCLSPFISTVQEAAWPLHWPPQPWNTLPAAGVWKTVRVDPVGTTQAQDVPPLALPQSIALPGGVGSGALMSPSSPVAATPSSAKVTDNVLCDVPDFGLNSATAMLSEPEPRSHSVSVEPPQSPDQVPAANPPPGFAESTTSAVSLNAAKHFELPPPQVIPPGVLLTVPLPSTCTVTVRVAVECAPALTTPRTSATSASIGTTPRLIASPRLPTRAPA